MMEEEGVTKFRVDMESCVFPKHRLASLEPLLEAREQMFSERWIGEDTQRYGGVGYGNVSVRVGPQRRARGERAFAISGTQTSGLSRANAEHFALVELYDVRRNWVRALGPVAPSSESMTHGMVYDLDTDIGSVLHAHWPKLWLARFRLKLPSTPAEVAYGTPEMARAVRQLWEAGAIRSRKVFAMSGHQDGIVSFGKTPAEALRVLQELEILVKM